jgi:hypothetical protein
VEVGTSEALVSHSAERLRPVIEALGMPTERWLRGYRMKALDGNHLAATERRLEVLRGCAAGPLPGQSWVVLEPVLAGVQPNDVYIADRNLCTLAFLFGIAARKGFFVIRQHAQLHIVSQGKLRGRGRTESGEVFEQSVTLRFDGQEAVSAHTGGGHHPPLRAAKGGGLSRRVQMRAVLWGKRD